MSFGWSVGDVIAGLKVVWDVWQAVSDGSLNAEYQASQFFSDFAHAITRLEHWEKRKEASAIDRELAIANQELREQCTLFIKKHMHLIQQENPQTKATRQGRSTWLQKAAFTRGQVVNLYQHVSWPFAKEEVKKLRERLQFFLQLATHDITLQNYDLAKATHDTVLDIRKSFRTSNAELLSSNLKLVSSHLDLVSLVTLNLKRVTYPFEPGREAQEIDYPMLRQFEQALRPPRPFQAIAGPPDRQALPWMSRSPDEDAESATVAPKVSKSRETSQFNQNEIRGLISSRLDNMSMRIGRVDTLESIPEVDARANISTATQPLLDRLRDMRDQIGSAVGITNTPTDQGGSLILGPETALREELEAWHQLEERIEREILHPGRLLSTAPKTTAMSRPIPIPVRKASVAISPGSSPRDGWHGSSITNTPVNGSSVSSSPNFSRLDSHSRTLSTSSVSTSPSAGSEQYLPACIIYSGHVVDGIIRSISRFDDNDVRSITTTSQDGTTEIRHSIDLKAPGTIETSMKPFLDNGHVDLNQTHRLRVQFKGTHNLKITKLDKISRYQCAPTYTFTKHEDFLQFQSLLLNKDVKYCADVKRIKSTDDDTQCHQATIRILLDPFTSSRYILYFRHTLDQKHCFVEWPANIFKDPKEPGKKATALKLESHDGKSLSASKGPSRRSTQGSVATINSFETSAAPAFGRIQDRSEGKRIKGLVIEFYDHYECYEFWREFRIKETPLTPSPMNQGLGFYFPAELP